MSISSSLASPDAGGNPLKRREIRRAGDMHRAKTQTFLYHLHDSRFFSLFSLNVFHCGKLFVGKRTRESLWTRKVYLKWPLNGFANVGPTNSFKNNAKTTQQMSWYGIICLRFSHAKVVIVSKIWNETIWLMSRKKLYTDSYWKWIWCTCLNLMVSSAFAFVCIDKRRELN